MKKKLLGIILSFAVAFTMLGCDGGFDLTDDFSDYLSGITQNEDTDTSTDEPQGGEESESGEPTLPDIPEPIEPPPTLTPVASIVGYTPIEGNVFDFGTPFFGSYALVQRNGNEYLLSIDGSLTDIVECDENTMSDIVIERTEYDRVVVSYDGKYGVTDLFGGTITEIIYNYVTVTERFIFGEREDAIDIFTDDNLACSVSDATGVVWAGGDYVYLDNGNGAILYFADDLMRDGETVVLADLARARISGLNMSDAPRNGMVKVENSAGNFGFCSFPDGEIVIEPQYLFATTFYGDYACANLYTNKYISNKVYYDFTRIIDKDGSVAFDFANYRSHFPELSSAELLPNAFHVYGCYDDKVLFTLDGSSGVVDLSDPDNIKCHYFNGFLAKGVRAYGDYLIESETESILSISSGEIVYNNSAVTTPFGDSFVIKHADVSYSLLDSSLSVVIENADNISVYEDTMLVAKEGRYSYYRIESKA